MVQSAASLGIIFMILLNHGIITVNSFDFSLDGLFEYGLNLLIDNFFYEEEEEVEEITMDEVVQQINALENSIKESEKTVITELGHIVRHESVMRDYAEDVSYILELYEQFQEYSKDYELFTLQNFAEISLTEGDNGLTEKLNNLVDLISPRVSGRKPLLELIVELYERPEKRAERCGKTISVQQEMYSMYGEIALYIIRGYAVKFNAYKILRKNGFGNFRKEKELTRNSYKEAMSKLISAAVVAMRISPKDIRSCDTRNHKEVAVMENYFHDSTQGICGGKCENFNRTTLHNVYWSSEWMKCSNEMFDCFSITGSSYFCPGTTDGVRYDMIGTYESVEKKCGPGMEIQSQYRKWRYYSVAYFSSCDHCVCACDDKRPTSVRRFSLKPVQSEQSKNQVITGLRFFEQDRVIYIQIQEGKLEPHGNIDASTIHWQTTDSSERTDWEIGYEDRSVNLDTLESPPGQALTGIKFHVRNRHLELNIMAHSFDYSTGVLHDGDGDWISSDEIGREKIEIEKADIPINAPKDNIVTLGKNKFVDFRMTDWDVDYSQTPVPFIDAQPVISKPPRPLSGAGIYYRGQEGYGGFIGLKLVAYDYGSLLAQKDLSEPGKKQKEEETGSTEVELSEGAEENYKAAPGVKAEFEIPKLDDLKELAEKFQRRKSKAERRQSNKQGHRQRNGSKGRPHPQRIKHRRGG